MKRSLPEIARLIWLSTIALLTLFAPLQTSAATQDPMDPLLARQLMRVMTEAEGDVSQMLAGLAELAERKRRPDDLKFIIRERAALLIQEEQLTVARTELQATLAGQPEEYAPALRYLLGQICLLEGDAKAAIEPLETWARYAQEPDPAGLFVLAYALVQLERFDAAATRLESIIANASIVRPQWIEVLAYVYAQLGRTDQAITLLNGLVAEQPDKARWWRQLATVYLIIENVPRGTAGFTVASELTDMEFADARRLSRLFGLLGLPADGAELLQQAIADSPDPVRYEDQMLLAELWIVAREFDAAIAGSADRGNNRLCRAGAATRLLPARGGTAQCRGSRCRGKRDPGVLRGPRIQPPCGLAARLYPQCRWQMTETPEPAPGLPNLANPRKTGVLFPAGYI
jgi:tetratricopeptide (TPR) repeat protein